MIKQSVKAILATPAGWSLCTPLRAAGVVVLMYHRINRGGESFPGLGLEQFRAQMRWIRRNCTVIGPEQCLEAAHDGSRRRPPVLVTFDDGYRDYHDNAYPVLDELGIPAVVFLATSFMDDGGMIWTDTVHWAGEATRAAGASLPWDRDIEFNLRDVAARAAFVRQCKRFLKDIPDAERQRWLRIILQELGIEGREDEVGRQMLNWGEIRATTGLTRYGGHTHTHPIMSQLAPAQQEQEIDICRDRIERETGIAPRYFAYPNGRAADFNDASKQLLRRHGFELAFTTIEGMNAGDVDPLALRRIPTGGANVGDFAWLVAGR